MQTFYTLFSLVVAVISGTQLEETIVELFRSYAPPIQRRHNPLLIEYFSYDKEARYRQQDLIGRLLAQLDGDMPLIQYNVRGGGKPSGNNLIFVDGYDSFRWFVQRWNRQRYDRGGYYWIVHLKIVDEGRDVVERILDATWELQILYAVVIVADYLEEDVELFTFWPYTDTHCGDVNPVRVNWRSVDLLEDRLKNLHGCVLKVGAFENRPFVLLDWDLMGNTKMLGFEGLLVNVLAKKLNFSVEVVVPPRNDQWGYLKKGGESTGLMKLLIDGTVHVGICSIGYTEERNSMLSPGIPHHTTYIAFAVPSGRPYTSFEKLFLPFSWDTWYAMFGTLLAALFIIVIINTRSSTVKEFVYGKGNWGPLTNMVNILFGGPLEKAPTGTFARTLLAYWLIFTMVIRTAYQGSLYKYLQVPKNFSAPLTMDAIDKSGLEYYMLDLAVEFFSNYPEVLARTSFLPHDKPLLEAITRIGRGELNGVVLVLVDNVAYHNKYFPVDEFVQVTRETVVGFPMGAFYPMNTFLRDTFNREIQMIDSSGLVQHWVDRGGDYDFTSDRRGAPVTVALSLDNLMGAFQILGVLKLVAVLVFLLELGSKRCRMVRRFVDWIEDFVPESDVLFVKSNKNLK